MPRFLVRLSAALALAGAGASGCMAHSPPPFTEYALVAPTDERLACWDQCMQLPDGEARGFCLSSCGGVVARETDRPCPRFVLRCTYRQAEPEPAEDVASEEADTSLDLIGSIIHLAVSAALGGDDSEDRAPHRHERHEHAHESAPTAPERHRASPQIVPTPSRARPSAPSGHRSVATPRRKHD